MEEKKMIFYNYIYIKIINYKLKINKLLKKIKIFFELKFKMVTI